MSFILDTLAMLVVMPMVISQWWRGKQVATTPKPYVYIDAGKQDVPVIVMFHGNATTAQEQADAIGQHFYGRAAVFIVEYPGYASRGWPTPAGIDAAADATFADAVAQFPASRIFIVGTSIGTGPAAALAARRASATAGLLLVSPYTSIHNIVRYYLEGMSLTWLSFLIRRDLYATADVLPSLASVRALRLVHGVYDDVIPMSHTEQLAERAPPHTVKILTRHGHDVDLSPIDTFLGSAQ